MPKLNSLREPQTLLLQATMKPMIQLKEKLFIFLFLITSIFAVSLQAQSPLRGSITDDRKAKKLLEAGDSRMEAD